MIDLPFTDDMAYRFDSLYQWLDRKYRLAQIDVDIAGKAFRIFKIANIDEVIEAVLEISQNPDEEAPYWAEIWPSALGLGQFVIREDRLSGKSVLELGSGLGIAGIAAREAGAAVVFSDIHDDALRMSELNFIVNFKSAPMIQKLDWRNPAVAQKFDIILAADVAYETRLFWPLIDTFNQILSPEGEILLSEPNRTIAKRFFEMLDQEGFEYQKYDEMVAVNEMKTNISIYRIVRK